MYVKWTHQLTQRRNKMTITLEAIKQAAKEMNMTELEAITQMQAGAAITGNDEVLEQLCAIKSELIGL
jgi:hypothetical protein